VGGRLRKPVTLSPLAATIDRFDTRPTLVGCILVVPAIVGYLSPDVIAGKLIPVVLIGQVAALFIARRAQPTARATEISALRSWFTLAVGLTAIANVLFSVACAGGDNQTLEYVALGVGVAANTCAIVGGVGVFQPFVRIPGMALSGITSATGFIAISAAFVWVLPKTTADAVPFAVQLLAWMGVVLLIVGGVPFAYRLYLLGRPAEIWIQVAGTCSALGVLGQIHAQYPVSIGVVEAPPTVACGLVVVALCSRGSEQFGRAVRDLSPQKSRHIMVLTLTVLLAGSSMILAAKIGLSTNVAALVTGVAVVQTVIVALLMTRRTASATTGHPATKALGRELRTAVVEGQIEPFYQPIFRAGDLRPAGYECLMRWYHPRLGLLTALEFVQAADDDDLLDDIDRIMWKRTLESLDQLLASLHADLPFISLNVPPRRLEQKGFANEIFEELARRGRDGTGIVLELTEHQKVTCWDQLITNVDALQAMGIGIAVDDFGTGSANYSTLLRIDPDIVKLDQSFMSVSPLSDRGRRLVKSAILAADSVGAQIIAEGVQDAEVATELQRLGVHLVQGFGLGNPASLAQTLAVG
jgi:EAL domain-containing protein (putative c-di-GMP-specific phosphodiesterase class I)